MILMDQMSAALENDAVLLPYLQATDETQVSLELETLICENAQPIIGDVIHRKLRIGQLTGSDLTADEAIDLTGEVTLKLVRRLRELRSKSLEPGIENFRGYVAVMTYHACDSYLRKKYPRRHSLKNQLRYVLTHCERFALWEADDRVWYSGFARWRDQPSVTQISRLREFVENASLANRYDKESGNQLNPVDLLEKIFKYVNGPVEFDCLVSAVADLWRVTDHLMPSKSIDAGDLESIANPKLTNQVETQLDQRAQLEKLWLEICELPLRQRVALLLALRDTKGGGLLALLPLIQIASIRQIAETLSMPAEQFSSLWNQLPLEDTAIAELLGVTRQQVINLRKSARERLWRRTRQFLGGM
jgi:hypothetical protein